MLYFLFLFLSPIHYVTSEKCSDPSYCLNGGTCLLNSGLPSIKKCSDKEVYYNNNCFSTSGKVLDWKEAAEYCHDEGSSLPLITTIEDQTFFSDFIQNSSALLQNRTTNGIWTAIRSVGNGSSPAWVSYPGSFLINQTFWKPGEPNLYPNWNDVCVSVKQETFYRSWQTQTCDQMNFVICQRKLSEEQKTLIRQCSCPSDYQGIRCEEKSDGTSTQTVLCSHKEFFHSCPEGTIIVDYASYGSSDSATCNDVVSSQQTCSNPYSLQTLINKCQGLNYCSFKSLPDLFPETPCYNKNNLQLHYRIRCSKEVQAVCPRDAFYYSGRCYLIKYNKNKNNKKNKKEAAEECRQQGGQLPVGLTSSSNEELARQIEKQTEKGNFWIALSTTIAGPKWEDGSDVTFTPSNSDLSQSMGCATISVTKDGSKWQSASCDEKADFVCEMSPTSKDNTRSTEAAKDKSEEVHTFFQGDTESKDIKDIFGDVKYCSENTAKGIRFPKTRACTEATVPCPDEENIIGTVVRYCNCKTGVWEVPNTTNCTHKWVSEIRASLDRGDPAEQISTNLAENLSNSLSRQLYGGDIVGSVSLSGDVLSLAKTQFSALNDRNDRQKRSANFTESLGKSGDQLLSPAALPVWEELETWKKIDHASRLMNYLEQSALLLADYTIESQKKISYNHWAMEIDVRQPEAYVATNAEIGIAQAPMDDTIENPSARISLESASPAPTIEFSSISKSPVISLPSFSTLKDSASTPTVNADVAQQAFFHPGGDGGSSLDRTRLRLGYYVFTTFSEILSPDDNSIINSHIIGASVDDATRSINLPDTEPVTFTFYHIQKTGVSNPRCVYWDLSLKNWNTEGCQLLTTNSTASQCACNHLTSFAILMDVSGKVSRYSGALASALDIVSIIGCSVSIVCLVLSLATFTFFRQLYNIRNTIHRNLCFCLLLAELIFVIGMDRTSNKTGCSVVALLLHYFFLASFCWMLIEGYQLYLMLIQVFESSKNHVLLYYIFSYGFPAVVVSVSAGVAWNNYGTDSYCWIDTSTPTLWAFIAPIIIVIIANVIFLLIALRVVLSVRSRDRNKTDRLVGWLKGSATLLCLLGITWVFGFLTAVKGGTGTAFAWIFTILNCTQGVFIFFLHVVMNDKVRLVIVRWIRTGVCCLPDNSSAYNSRSYISSRQRIMNMVKSHSRSDPSTASTDDKDNQLTPTSKTNQWLRHMSNMQESISSDPNSDDVMIDRREENRADIESQTSTDPRGSQDLPSDVMEKQAPVKRKKFPLGATEMERASTHRNAVIIERF